MKKETRKERTDEMKAMKIDGITYKVVNASTPEQKEAAGLPNTARVMRENGILENVLMVRAHGGRVLHSVNVFKTDGPFRYSKVSSLGFRMTEADMGRI